MNIWKLILGLSYRQIFSLSWLMLSNPLLIFPTLKATQRTIILCEKYYGKTHHGNGKANAFRHALWNMLICCSAIKVKGNRDKAVFWAKRITDLYEKIVPNAALETAMDLHNNQIGRDNFLEIEIYSEQEVLSNLVRCVEESILVDTIQEMTFHKTVLVYISEEV